MQTAIAMHQDTRPTCLNAPIRILGPSSTFSRFRWEGKVNGAGDGGGLYAQQTGREGVITSSVRPWLPNCKRQIGVHTYLLPRYTPQVVYSAAQ